MSRRSRSFVSSSPGNLPEGGPQPAAGGEGLRLHPEMSVRDLKSWAEQEQVSQWLGVSVAALKRPQLPRSVAAWIRRATKLEMRLQDVICGHTKANPDLCFDNACAPREGQRMAIELLRKEAEIARAGILEEEARAARREPPQQPRLAALFKRWARARAELRKQMAPRPAHLVGPIELRVDGADEVLYCRERVKAPCSDSKTPTATLRLRPDKRRGEVSAGCTCKHAGAGRCTVVLAALDRALDLLGGVDVGADAKVLAEIEELLTGPTWGRALRVLDRLLPGGGPALGAELELDPDGDAAAGKAAAEWPGWLVQVRESSYSWQAAVHLQPALCRAYKRRSGTRVEQCSWDAFARALQRHSYSANQQLALDLLRLDEADAWPRWWDDADKGDERVHLQALAALAGSSNLYVRGNGREGVPIRVRCAELTLQWRRAGSKRARRVSQVEVVARAAGREWPPAEFWRMVREEPPLAGYWLLAEWPELILIRASSAAGELIAALAEGRSRFPAEALPAIAERLPALARVLPVTLDAELRGAPVAAEARPLARLALRGESGLQVRLLMRPLAAGGRFVPGEGPLEVYGRREEQPVFARRDPVAERAGARAAAAALGLEEAREVAPFAWLIAERDAALTLVERLQELEREGRLLAAVEWRREQRLRVAGTASPGNLRLRVKSIGEWFQVGGDLTIGDTRVPLEALLEAAREARQTVAVGGSTWVRLDAALRRCLRSLSEVVEDTRAQTSALRAPAIDAIAGEAGVSVTAPAAWNDLLARVRRAEQIDTTPPAELRAELRDYQLQGQAWLARCAEWSPGVCLADDMGLGKTVQALALLLRRADRGPALVVAPTSVGFNWVREAERFAPGLRSRLYRGPDRRALLADLGPGDLLITSYQLAQRDVEELAGLSFATLVLDESQAVKNPDAKRTRAVARLRAEFRLALTGTPLENRLAELWSLFQILAPGLLGNRASFRERFVLPIERAGDEARRAALARLVRPFILRRTKAQVATDLPPRTEMVLEVELSAAERRLYEETRAAALTAIADRSGDGDPNRERFQLLAALTRLRQIACHPALVAAPGRVTSAKLIELRERLGELLAEGHRALVFSQFTRLLALVREELSAAGVSCRYLDGSTPEKKRRSEVDAFQRGEGQVFLISLKAGGTGLNLTAATYVFHLDPWWNPAVEDQASDRAHRIGQKQPVTIYRLVARDTIEQSILALQEEKRRLVEGVLSGSNAAGALTTQELLALLRGAGEAPPRAPESTAEPNSEPEPEPGGEQLPAPVTEPASRAPGAPGAPANPAARASANPTARASRNATPILFEDATEQFATLLERATADGRFSPPTGASYQRIGNRFLDYLAERHDYLPPSEQLAAEAARYAEAVRDQRFPAPASDCTLVSTVARHLAQALRELEETPAAAG